MTNIDQYVAFLTKHNLGFYHFTDVRNLPSIRQYGLRCTSHLGGDCRAIATGGNDVSLVADRRSGMDQYVHLCMFRQHPLEFLAKQEGRIVQSQFIKVSPEVLRVPGALISLDVSNAGGARMGPVEEYADQMDLQVIYTRTDWKDAEVKRRLLAARKYELLIPSSVSLGLLSNI